MRRILHWLDNNLLVILAGFLLVFIPLYPKWPLFDILYGYNVRVRLEDFFVAVTFGLFLFQLFRRRVSVWQTPVAKTLLAYLVVGALSMLAAFFVVQSVPLLPMHVGKTFLHWLRRVEYFSLFFVLFASVRSWKTVKIYLGIFFLTFLVVIIYGFGQKYLYFPAFSTMNREFAKGWWLYLTEHARVLSTFGGHYDLAAYLVVALTLTWSFFFGAVKKRFKLILGLLLAGGFWLLILTASRSSFLGYLAGLFVVCFLWTFKKGLGWGISRYLTATFLSILLMLSFGDLSDRFLHLLRLSDRVTAIKAVLLRPAGQPPKDQAMFLENNLAAVALKSDVPPSLAKPSDVTAAQDFWPVTTTTASGASTVVVGPRGYSQNALLFDLSTGIRLDATWPMAWKGFLADPLLGSGYATLNKTSKYDFTDAESTDNDFLRSLGETGLLGFLAFYGTMVLMVVVTFRVLGGVRDPVLYSLSAGFIGLVIGLLINAVLVDLFEASKVAYVFWGVSGLTLGSLYLARDRIKTNWQPLQIDFSWPDFWQKIKKFFLSDKPWVVLLLILAFWLRTYKFDGPVADWHSWRQADTSAVTRDFVRQQKIDWLYPTYDDLSSIASGKPNPKGLRFVEFPLYNAASAITKHLVPELTVEEAGRVVTDLATTLSVLFIFLICRTLFSRRLAYLSALCFTLLPYSIYYGRVILPDPSMVAASLGTLWFGLKYTLELRKRYFILSVILGVAALLIKPFAIFLLLPLAYFWLVGFGLNRRRLLLLGSLVLLWSLPLLLWHFWISHFPEGIPASAWLLNGDGIRFKGAFWYWLFADRIGRLILGYWGLVLLGFGLVQKMPGKYRHFPLVLLLSSLAYLFVFATGNVRHDYYQILIIPSLAIFLGVGLDTMLAGNWRTKLLAVVSLLFTLGFGWYFVRDYFNINHPEIVAAGQRLQQVADQHERALVVAPYDGDTAFLYQTNHKGWPIVEKPIPDMIKMGASYYISVKFDDLTSKLLANSETKEERVLYPKRPRKSYTLLARTDQYAIIQLVPDKDLPGN